MNYQTTPKTRPGVRALALLLSALLLASCSETAPDPSETPETPDPSEVAVEEEVTEYTRENYPDSLAAGLDFGSADYRIMCPELVPLNSLSATNEMLTDEITGEVVNDAIYNRAMSVMDRLNVKISKVVVDDSVGALREAAVAGDDSCEISACYAFYAPPLALEGLLVDWLDVDHVDLNQPWWPDSLSTDIVIDDSLYFISGDISMRLLQYTYCMFFNKSLAENWNIPNLYDLVLEGKWTLDKYMEITSDVSQDVNGDGKYDKSDLYGTLNNPTCDVRYACYDIPLSGRDENGFLTLTIMTEKFVDVFTRLHEYYHSSNSVARFTNDLHVLNMFTEDRLLILPYLVVIAENIREMESDYGIIPYPKYNEEQENYATTAHDNYSLMCVPVTVPDDRLEMIGATTEAMAAESYRKVTPAYLEVTLKDKFLRDENSQEMLDIITSTIEFDALQIYANSVANVMHIFRELTSGKQDIASWYKKKEKTYLSALETFNTDYAKLSD